MSVAASSLSFIDGSILNVALPAIRAGTGAGAAEVQWVVNIYTLPLAALILLGGALGDHHGRRLWLVIGTALFGLGSLACAISGSLELLLAGRALQGIGAALLLPNSLALLNGVYEGEARGQAIGTWAAAGAIAAAIAPMIGGWLVEHVGWPSIFYINLPLVAAAILVALTRVEEVREPEKARLDLGGALLATLGLGAATYGLTLWSQKFTLTPMASIGLVARRGAAACLPVLGTAAWRQGDGAPVAVRQPLLLCAQPDDLPALRSIRRRDAAHPLCADRGRRLFPDPGRPVAPAAVDPARPCLAADGQACCAGRTENSADPRPDHRRRRAAPRHAHRRRPKLLDPCLPGDPDHVDRHDACRGAADQHRAGSGRQASDGHGIGLQQRGGPARRADCRGAARGGPGRNRGCPAGAVRHGADRHGALLPSLGGALRLLRSSRQVDAQSGTDEPIEPSSVMGV